MVMGLEGANDIIFVAEYGYCFDIFFSATTKSISGASGHGIINA